MSAKLTSRDGIDIFRRVFGFTLDDAWRLARHGISLDCDTARVVALDVRPDLADHDEILDAIIDLLTGAPSVASRVFGKGRRSFVPAPLVPEPFSPRELLRLWGPEPKSRSVWTCQGGLPSLGKRR